MNKRRLQIDATRCTGCNSCVLTCSQIHEGAFSLAMSRVTIASDPIAGTYEPRVCVQCEEAPCIESCPTNALSKDPDSGAIVLSPEACTGCRNCVKACPYGGVGFDSSAGKPLICDLCGGDPQCVAVCSLPHAITYSMEKGTS